MTGCEQLIGRVVTVVLQQGGRIEMLPGVVTLEDTGTAGVLVASGERRLFLAWHTIASIATQYSKSGADDAPTDAQLRALWGGEDK